MKILIKKHLYVRQLVAIICVLISIDVFAMNWDPQRCVPKVRKMVCEGEMREDSLVPRYNCGAKNSKYIDRLEEVYLAMPTLLQKLFCSLDYFVVVDEHESIASPFYQKGRPPKLGIAYNKFILDSGINAEILNDKYDYSLMQNPQPYPKWSVNHDKIKFNHKIKINGLRRENYILFTVLVHELGHLLDYAMEINAPFRCFDSFGVGGCGLYKSYLWSRISWETPFDRKMTSGYSDAFSLCYYQGFCELNRSFKSAFEIHKLYSELQKSDFVSLYSTSAFDEDFAESLKFYVIWRYFKDSKFTIEIEDQTVYDYMEKIKSKKFEEKRKFLDRLFDLNDVESINFRKLLEQKLPSIFSS